MENLIEVALILKPHGIKGQVKAKNLAFSHYEFLPGKTLLVDSSWLEIEEVSGVKDELVIKFKGVDLDLAQRLKNKSLFAKRADLKPTDDFYCADLIGKTAVDLAGKPLGKIDDIENYGSADVVYVKGKKSFTFANIGGIIEEIKGDSVVLNDKKLSEVICYED